MKTWGCVTGFLTVASYLAVAPAQTGGPVLPAPISRVDGLALPTADAQRLRNALDAQRYVDAEQVLLEALAHDSASPRAARLLNFAGGVYFLNHDYLNAAVAWNKAETLGPLDQTVQFSLAMAYVKLNRRDWAISQLRSLQARNERDALYPYWLGRLHYDAHLYDEALIDYNRATALAPSMARAYDGLGLCYFYKNQNDLAIRNYNKALALEASESKPSAWTHLDLAETLQFVHRDKEAEEQLREAVRLNPQLAQAHFQLGTLLRQEGKTEPAIVELEAAASLDPNYAEPHFVLARIFNGLGRKAEAQAEVDTYHRIHDQPGPGPASASGQDRP